MSLSGFLSFFSIDFPADLWYDESLDLFLTSFTCTFEPLLVFRIDRCFIWTSSKYTFSLDGSSFGSIVLRSDLDWTSAFGIGYSEDKIDLESQLRLSPMTWRAYVFERTLGGFWEQEVYSWQDDDYIHGGEESISSPADLFEHWSRYPSYQLYVDDISTHMTTKKLNSQLDAVDKAFAGALILIGVTSAGYSQDIPNQPIVLGVSEDLANLVVVLTRSN